MSEINTLIKMANQIAENFSFHDDQVQRTADHIKRFWASPMRRKLAAYIADGGEGLSQAVLKAMSEIEA